ncbi:MAG: hypothetical protein KDE27_03850 [Planctomycetes bacterium]|nr:hypothetical protein [Planctomycetota bacterium]
MRHAHQPSCQTGVLSTTLIALSAAATLGGASGCTSSEQVASIWPPADFDIEVEEFSTSGDQWRARCRFRVRADGLATYATAGGVVVDPETGTELPVWSRLAVYRLVPTCTRALARRVHRAGVLDLVPEQGQRGGDVDVVARLRWQAFDRRQLVRSRGRVHGSMAEILAIVAAHLPEGESLGTPGVEERRIAPVLRGVPAPRDDAAGALAAHLELAAASPADRELLLAAFALACSLGRRVEAEELLTRWQQLEPPPEPSDEDEPPALADVRLSPAMLRRMLPPAR